MQSWRLDVLSLAEGVDECRVVREVGEDPQFDLAVIRREELPSLLGQEGPAYLTAQLRADRDVLQIGVRTAQAARGGDRLVESARGCGPVPRIHQFGQGVHVGALELRQLPEVQNLLRQGVLRRQPLQRVDVGGRPPFSFS